VQIIGSGFGRTGTRSTKDALELLGFGPCYHMEEVIKRPRHARAWLDRAEGRPVDWHELFAGWGSTVDFPASVVWEELLEAFPDAKVLHTVRDPDEWWESTVETIATTGERVDPWLRRLVPAVDTPFRLNELLVWDGVFGGRIHDRRHAMAVFEAWTAHVVDTVPADRLLVFDVRDGWAPLCAFLDVPVPDVPYPRRNDRAEMRRVLRALELGSRAVRVGATVAPIAAAAAVSRRRARRRRAS
jgi:hypothetical protein